MRRDIVTFWDGVGVGAGCWLLVDTPWMAGWMCEWLVG